MIGGFGLVAYPAEYRNSGVMRRWSRPTRRFVRLAGLALRCTLTDIQAGKAARQDFRGKDGQKVPIIIRASEPPINRRRSSRKFVHIVDFMPFSDSKNSVCVG
jgi:hypothetical protein